MKFFFVQAALMLCAFAANAQEKAMRLHKTDATYTLTRVSELSKISFLSIAGQGKAMIVNTVNSETVAVLIENRPEVTVSDGCLTVTSKSADCPVTIEINDICEIKFEDTASSSISAKTVGIVCSILPNTALFRGVPENTNIRICTVDGRSVPVQKCVGGELRLTRSKFGSGIYIVRIGTFVAKITI